MVCEDTAEKEGKKIMIVINVATRPEIEVDEVMIVKQDQNIITLHVDEKDVIQLCNTTEAQKIGSVTFDTVLATSPVQKSFVDYERLALQHAKELLLETDYFYLNENGQLRLTPEGWDQIPDGRAIIF